MFRAIVTIPGRKAKQSDLEWYLTSEHQAPKIEGTICYSFYADGKELDYIEKVFKNVPVSNHNSCVWKGQFAQFIYDNL